MHRETAEDVNEVGIGACLGMIRLGARRRLRLESLHEAKMASLAAAGVGERSAGDPVAPRKGTFRGEVVETSPHRQHDLGEKILGLVMAGTPA